MPLLLDRALCLRVSEYSETSQLVSLLTRENGRVRTLAKGARRRTRTGDGKCGGGVDQLEVGHAVFIPRQEGLSLLSEWTLDNGHLPLRRDRRGITLGQYAAELTGMLLEEFDPHPEIFDAFVHALPQLAVPAVQEYVGLSLVLDVVRSAGVLPELQHCIETGRRLDEDERAEFSPTQGGVVAMDAPTTLTDLEPIHPRVRRMLIRLSDPTARSPVTIARRAADAAHRLLALHVAAVLGQPLRMTQTLLNKPLAAHGS